MILSPAPSVAGHRAVRSLGLVYRNIIRARHVGRDVLAVVKSVVGGEIEEFTNRRRDVLAVRLW